MMDRLPPTCVWVYRTSKSTSVQATAFSLIYGAEGVVPIEITSLSARLALESKILDLNSRIYEVEALEERRRNSKKKMTILPGSNQSSI